MDIVFMGGRQVGCIGLLALLASNDCSVKLVVCNGRDTEALSELAERFGVPVVSTINHPLVAQTLHNDALLVSVHGSEIVRASMLGYWGGINIHPFPFKGADPIGKLLRDGGETVRLTAHRMTDEVDVEYRDPVVQIAFGRTLLRMNLAQRAEFSLSWIGVIFLLSGVILGSIWLWGSLYISIALTAFVLFLSSVAIPHISLQYGVPRTYLTSLIILTPLFIAGLINVSEMLHVNGYIIGFVVVALLSLCVSGKLHSLLGYNKRAYNLRSKAVASKKSSFRLGNREAVRIDGSRNEI